MQTTVRIKPSVWERDKSPLSREDMDFRLRCARQQRLWQELRVMLSAAADAGRILTVIEVGCGTGTMSLLCALSGARVVLIDESQSVLDRAQKIFGMYGYSPECVRADCLDSVPPGIKESADIVLSVGLFEHFRGSDRIRCLRYHYGLAGKGGRVFVHCPNTFSVLYWSMRLCRTLAGKWPIDLEIPSSFLELRRLARTVGLYPSSVFGYVGFGDDVRDYARSYFSALQKILRIRGKKNRLPDVTEKTLSGGADPIVCDRSFLNAVSSYLCSNIVLAAVKKC
jgi:SAM-dependent methyltransferase